MKKRRCGWCLAAAVLCAAPAYGAVVSFPWAADGSGPEKNLNTILGMSTADISAKQITADEVWSTAIGNLFTTLIVEFAGDAGVNKFGVYDTVNGNKMTIFPGSSTGGASANLVISTVGMGTKRLTAGSSFIDLTGTSFGFYLQNGTGTYYSESYRNGNKDQMVTYNLDDTALPHSAAGWALAFEDRKRDGMNAGSDEDYNDMVLTLSAAPVPETSTIVAGALLLLPFGASTIRFLRKNRAQS